MPPLGGLWYWALNMTKQNTQPKTGDNYCPHLNPLHRETLLSLHLRNELLWMAHKVTGTGHPFLQDRKGTSHNMAGHALYDRIHKATPTKENRLVSIGVTEGNHHCNEPLWQLQSRKGYVSMDSWFTGNSLRACQPRINTTLQKPRLHLYPCNGIRPHMDY